MIRKTKYETASTCTHYLCFQCSASQRRLDREISVWSKVDHCHILPFLGISDDFDRLDTPCLVSPYYSNGNIKDYIKKHSDANMLGLVSHITNVNKIM